MSRQTAIRARCLDCSGQDSKEVRNCEHAECYLYPYRITKGAMRSGKAQAIKDYCTECCGGSIYERAKCTAVNCPLWEYRTGRHTPITLV